MSPGVALSSETIVPPAGAYSWVSWSVASRAVERSAWALSTAAWAEAMAAGCGGGGPWSLAAELLERPVLLVLELAAAGADVAGRRGVVLASGSACSVDGVRVVVDVVWLEPAGHASAGWTTN